MRSLYETPGTLDHPLVSGRRAPGFRNYRLPKRALSYIAERQHPISTWLSLWFIRRTFKSTHKVFGGCKPAKPSNP